LTTSDRNGTSRDPALPDTSNDSRSARMIELIDERGRRLQMTRDEWRTGILLPNLKRERDRPDALYDLIYGALRDGFAADALEPARHLATIDPNKIRAATLLGVVLLELGDHDQARRVLEDGIAQYGEDGYALTNLAKAHYGLGDHVRVEQVLWRALECDPNQEGGLEWHAVIARERGGDEAEQAAFARVATLPGSWRAQLWLAQAALARDETDAAVQLYRQALSRMDPVPADALMQISADLGKQGHLALILDLCAPRFDIGRHGLMVGNNLIKANLELGRTAEARSIVDQLYACRRPDWYAALAAWQRRIDEAEQQRHGPVN
jgi:tetratricopeptide (TPR) repeat protein